MLKTLGAQIKEFKKDSFLTPVFMILEVLMETIIPLMMASIIDNGVEAGDIHHIYVMGGCMVIVACISLFAGTMGGKYGARASAGFARNLRKAMYENIQTFSFSNIDKFRSCHPSYHRRDQPAERISDAFAHVRPRTDLFDLRNDHGIFHQCKTCFGLSDRRYRTWYDPRNYHCACTSLFYGSISKIR